MKGRVRLHVLDLGRLVVDPRVLLADAPPGERVVAPVSAYVVEHSDGRVLFDTGCHPLCMGADGLWPAEFQQAFPWDGGDACQLPNRLAALGLKPDDFSTVVVSHLHGDHAGCVEYFRRSKLVVHAQELAAALGAQDDRSYVRAEVARWRGLEWQPIVRDLRLNDAATVLAWGSGHATGMLGLHVRLPKTGDILLASDALYCAESFAPAFRAPGSLLDPAGWEKTARQIAALAGRLRARVWFGHDAEQFATLRHAPGGCYE
jgi:N-acyl homoserine lactone hydrolase